MVDTSYPNCGLIVFQETMFIQFESADELYAHSHDQMSILFCAFGKKQMNTHKKTLLDNEKKTLPKKTT